MKQKRILITSLVAAATLSVPSAAFAATALDGDAAAWDYAFASTDYKNVANIADARALISGEPDYFVDGNVAGSDGALRIGAETASGEGVSGVVITNANQGTQPFAADLTGTGVFAVYFGSTVGTTYDFQGDVSGFSGDFYVNVLESGRSNTLQFSHAGSSALSGTGALETNRALSYAVASGAATIANASISAATLDFSGNTAYTVNSDVSVSGTLSVASGATATFNGSVSASGGVSVASGATADFGTVSGGQVNPNARISGAGTVKVVSTATDHSTQVFFADDFSGTLDYAGKINLTNMNGLGSAAKIEISANGSNNSMWGSGTFANDLHFKTDYRIGDSTATTVTLNGNVSAETGTTFSVGSGSTATFAGARNAFDKLYLGNATVNFGAAEAADSWSSVTSVETFVMGQQYGGNGTANINAGAVLTVTGSSGTPGSTGATPGSFMLGEWDTSQTVNVAGVLNLENAGVTAKNGKGTINVNAGGEVNFNKGLTFAAEGNTPGAITVVLNEGGRINIARDAANGVGIPNINGNVLNLQLNGGTIGTLSSTTWMSERAVALGGNVTFDTTQMAYNADGKATSTGNASMIRLTGVVSGEGGIVKTGAGSLRLDGDNTFTGGVTISEGVVRAGHANALGNAAAGADVRIENGAQLSVMGGVTLNAVSIEIVLDDAYLTNAALISTANRVADGSGGITEITGGTLSEDTVITLAGGEGVALDLASGLSYELFGEDLTWTGVEVVLSDELQTALAEAGLKGTWNPETGKLDVSSVPEPSAFGLLAGAFALALAVSRRRRK